MGTVNAAPETGTTTETETETETGDTDADTDTGTASTVTVEQVRTFLDQYNQMFYDGEITFSVDVRPFKRRAGQYDPTAREIAISSYLLDRDEQVIRTFLKHELAHAAVHQLYDDRRKPHGETWQNEMGRMGVDDPDVTHDMELVSYRYVFTCTGCGNTVGRHRKSTFVKQYDRYRCGECGDWFKQIRP